MKNTLMKATLASALMMAMTAAQAEADQVAPDGSSVGTSMPFWVGDPHFFKGGKLIVLYLGDDADILSALESVLGEQFAGR